MLTISNALSFSRIPLAFLFWVESPWVRLSAILLAMVSDSFDGYLARKNQSVSRFGAVLDPLADKFFVYFALSILLREGKLFFLQALAMLSRDIVVDWKMENARFPIDSRRKSDHRISVSRFDGARFPDDFFMGHVWNVRCDGCFGIY
jgi:phosphatidylglycerophosphate synthase